MDQQNELTFGQYLKNAREKSNFTIEKFALKTRINANILKSLENEDYKSLPSPAYLKGFILNYVKMFALDESEVFQKLQESYLAKTGTPFPSLYQATKHQVKTPHRIQEEPSEVINNSENIIDATKSFVPYVIGVLLIVAAIVGYQVVSKMINKEARGYSESEMVQTEASESSEDSPEAVVDDSLDSPAVAVEEKKEVKEVKEVKTETAVIPPVEKKTEAKTNKSKRNFPSIEFKALPTNLYTIKKNAPENQDNSLMPESYKAKLNPELQNLYIHALGGETWLSYKVDDEEIQNEFIREGKALFLQGKIVRMFFGNVNVTKIFLNNELVDAPSKSGVKTVVFPKEKAPQFFRPLFPHSTQGEVFTSEEYMKRMQEEEGRISNP